MSVILSGVCVVEGHAWWQGACMVGGLHGGCVAGGIHGGGGDAWWQWGGMCGGREGMCGGKGGGMRRIQRDTVNEQAVRILLECILVVSINIFMISG